MKLSFLGAARTVTGSCYVLETATGRMAVDCGLHQGNEAIEARNLDMSPYHPAELKAVIVTHAHIDHCGLLPRLAKAGFTGTIYTTAATADLLEIMLLDSAHIQEMEAEQQSRKRKRGDQPAVEPLYTTEDVHTLLPLVRPVAYGERFEPLPGVRATLADAGHILGSAFVELEVTEDGHSTSLVFSGDLGREGQLLLEDPAVVNRADWVFMESTYGDRDHKGVDTSRDELAEAINWAAKRGEKTIIPAFALERSQEIIYVIHQLLQEGRIPRLLPVYLDSPLAIRATEVFKQHPEYLDDDFRALLQSGQNPLTMPNLKFTLTAEESRQLNELHGPAVIIAASGMANAGRIRHHLRHNLWKPEASIVFAGFQAQGTTGRKIVDGAKSVKLFGDDVAVRARVFTIGGFSAHAGQSQMLRWLGNFKDKAPQVCLVHGEAKAQDIFAGLIHQRLGFTVHVPEYLEEMTLEPGQAPAIAVHPDKAAPRIDWDFLLGETEGLLGRFRQRLDAVQAKDWAEQAELRDRLGRLNQELTKLASEL